MNDDQNTKEQLLEDLAQERVLLGRERERSAQAEERSVALQEVSKRLAGAHDTEEVLDLIVNEATRLVGAKAGFIRLLEGGVGVPTAATTSAAGYLAERESTPAVILEEGKTVAGHVMATMKPLVLDDGTTAEMIRPHNRLLLKKHGFMGSLPSHWWSMLGLLDYFPCTTGACGSLPTTKFPCCPPSPTRQPWPSPGPGY